VRLSGSISRNKIINHKLDRCIRCNVTCNNIIFAYARIACPFASKFVRDNELKRVHNRLKIKRFRFFIRWFQLNSAVYSRVQILKAFRHFRAILVYIVRNPRALLSSNDATLLKHSDALLLHRSRIRGIDLGAVKTLYIDTSMPSVFA